MHHYVPTDDGFVNIPCPLGCKMMFETKASSIFSAAFRVLATLTRLKLIFLCKEQLFQSPICHQVILFVVVMLVLGMCPD
uniref:Uncharacterized protein n=1 Tax=Arundo donax TaxID=35708 RepID=A0A0A9BP63_ARUDO